MINPRSYTSVAALDNKIYVSGGWQTDGSISSAERYDPVLDKWESIAPMEHSR